MSSEQTMAATVATGGETGRTALRIRLGHGAPVSALARGPNGDHDAGVPAEDHGTRKQLRMVPCSGCGAALFLPGDAAPLSFVPCTKCGTPVMIPMRLRQFELRAPIASGGMGTVYRAFDTTLEREVAVKLVKRELVNDEQAMEGFFREARACAQLNHTNIIHLYTFDEWDGQLYLVMELADRGSLDGRIERGRVPELDVLDVGIKVASALNTALKHGLLHRDIKPGNILFNADGEPKLVDFGLARRTDAEQDADGTVWGTPYYIAPEKVRREREDFLSDLYSLAGTLYHAITQHVPFEAPTVEDVVAAHVHTPLTPPHQVLADVTLPTSDAITRAMAKKPADRFQSYDEFVMALEAARSQYLVGRFVNRTGPAAGAKTGGIKSWFRRS
jgi:serine/threonine protein kinase